MISLVNQTFFPQSGTYRLEIISAPSKRIWSTAYTFLVLKNQWILSIVNWCWNALHKMLRGSRVHYLHAWLPLNMFIKCISTSIKNRQNSSIFQNKKGIGSRPDPFWGGAYNLQLISATMREKGLVHETNHACRLALSSIKREWFSKSNLPI